MGLALYPAWVWLRVQWDALRLWLRCYLADWKGQNYIVLLGYGSNCCWPAFRDARNFIAITNLKHGLAPHMTYADALDTYCERQDDAPWVAIYDTKRKEYIFP